MDKIAGIFTWLLANWTGLLAVLFTFGFMIFIHELGHFLMAKRVGITVHEFALGFGPRLLQFGGRKDDSEDENEKSPSPEEPVETRYCLRAIPFGGFVSMEGEDDPGNPDDPGNFNNKSVWARFRVIVAGCFMNYVAGITLLLVVGLIWGIAAPNPPAVVGAVIEGKGYPMEKSGILPGDRIVKVNGADITTFYELSQVISPMTEGQEVNLIVDRKGKAIPFSLKVKYDAESKRGMLGFAPAQGMMGFRFIKQPAGTVVAESFRTAFNLTIMPVTIVKMLVTKKMTAKQVGEGTAGPIGISQMLFDISKDGLPSMLYMCAVLSILIGAFNLIPFPALDGARALFLGIEWFRKKPLDPAKEGMVHQLGFIVLMIMVLIVSYNDIIRLIKGGSMLR